MKHARSRWTGKRRRGRVRTKARRRREQAETKEAALDREFHVWYGPGVM